MSKGRAPWRVLTICFVVGIALTAFVVFGLASTKRNGRAAPALPSEHLSGRTVTIAALRGRPAIVSFWASWCEPCAREAPVLERFSRKLGNRAQLVGVNWSDPSVSSALAFIKRYGWSFPNLRDQKGTIGLEYGLTDLPTTFVIDARGRIEQTLRGPQTQQALTAALASVDG